MLLIILFTISLLLLVTLLKRRRIYSLFKSYRLTKLIQGPPLWPIIGSYQFLGLDAVQVYALGQKYAKCYANGFRLWAFGKLIYVSYTADGVEAIITNTKNIQKSFNYDFLHKFLGNGLLVSSDQKWFQRRKILTPAFHFNMLRKFVPSMKHQTKILINVLIKEQNNPNGTNLQEVISRFTLNTICETAMGVTLTKATELDEYRTQIHEYGDVHINRVITPWLHSDVLYKLLGKEQKEIEITRKVHKFTGEIIANRRKTLSDNIINYEDTIGKQRHAMLDTLLIAENNGQIDETGIQEEVDTFVFEGYDTTMTAITFTLLMISHHSDVQERLYKECKGIYDDRDTDDSSLDVSQYNELKYLECVIKETLRLYPPVPVIGRQLGDETIIDGIKFPIGTIVNIMITVLHRDPLHFVQPDRFDPERFTLENSQHRHPFAYIPFSGSHRNCIGQKFAMLEMKIVISEILKHFYLEAVTKIEEVTFKSDMVLRTQEPLRIRFVSRY